LTFTERQSVRRSKPEVIVTGIGGSGRQIAVRHDEPGSTIPATTLQRRITLLVATQISRHGYKKKTGGNHGHENVFAVGTRRLCAVAESSPYIVLSSRDEATYKDAPALREVLKTFGYLEPKFEKE